VRADEITKVIRSYDPIPWRDRVPDMPYSKKWYDTLKDTMWIMVVEIEQDR
jgi:hypothetical protein